MQTQLLIILSLTAALTFVIVVTSIGLVIHKSVNAQTLRRRQRAYTHYSNWFAEILLQDLPPLPAGSRTSAIFAQYEALLDPIKREFVKMGTASYRFHREVLRQVLVDFARDLTGDASDRLIYCFYSLNFVDEQIALLRSRHWWIRAQAARDLGLLKTKRAMAALTAAIEDPHPDVRNQARKAIVSLAGVESLRTILRLTKRMSNWAAVELSIAVMQYKEEAVPFLVEGLTLHDDSVVLFCIEMLAEIGFVTAVEPLRSLAATYPNVVVRARAVEALGRLGDARAESLLTSMIQDPQPALRIKAIEALGRIGAPGAVPMLLKRLADGSINEQLASARAIGASGAEGRGVLQGLTQSGTGRQPAVCRQILEELE